jgi:hypothetical protein
MKRILLVSLVMLGALAVSGGPGSTGRGKAASRFQSAVVEFDQTVRLQGVLLRGQYLIAHEEELMAYGEPCTYIYHGTQVNPSRLVIAFHCIPVERESTNTFKVTLSRPSTPYAIPEVKEYQFAGSTEGHRIP